MRFIGICLLGIVTLHARSCRENDFAVLKGQVIEVFAPDEVTSGANFIVQVNFEGGNNGCATADRVELTYSQNGVMLIPFYKVPTDTSLVCAMVMPVHTLDVSVTMPKTDDLRVINEDGVLLKTVRQKPLTHE